MSEIKEKNFIEQFCKTFEMYSYGNALYGRLCAHILLGQILKNIRIYFGPFYIDPRISLFLLQPSGTGKSVPWDYIKAVGEKGNLKIGDIDVATDAALIGTEESSEEIDPETKVKITKHNKIMGKLSDFDILHYDEGQMLVKRGQHSLNTLAWFQKTLNPIGTGHNLVTKNLAHIEISFHPSCSLLITSHEIENLLDVVLDTGFFQRIVLYPRYIPITERRENELLRAGRMGKRIFTEVDVETLGEKLIEIRQKYGEKWEIKVDENVYPVLKSKISELYKLINTAHERIRTIMATFAPRYNNLMYVLSLHHSCVLLKDKIDIEDVKYAEGLTRNLFKEVMTWVEENISLIKLTSKEQSYLDSCYRIYKSMEQTKEGYVMMISFMNKCSKKWRITMPTVYRYIEKFKSFNKIKEVEIKNVRMIKIEL